MAARPPGIPPLPPDIDETAPPQRSPLRGVLPFGPPAPVRPAPLRAVHEAPRPAAPPSASGEETAPPSRSPLAAALPFRRARASPATIAVPATTPEDLRRLTGAGANPASSPAGAPGSPGSPPHFGLTLEQYAALCAEVAVFPAAAEATFARYGLAARKDRMAADLGWQRLLREDPARMARWESLYLEHHERCSLPGPR